MQAGVLLLGLAAASGRAQTYNILHSFGGFAANDGALPEAGLMLSGTTLYGTTSQGGTNGYNYGIVFKVNTDGSGYTMLKPFGGHIGNDGALPVAGLVLSGTTLYGTTEAGGTNVNGGTVFKVNTDGSGYTVLKSFGGYIGNDGTRPEAGLVLSGTTLYGTTAVGGISNRGTVFKLNIDGSGYTMLNSFGNSSGNDGALPEAGLMLSGTTLYGTTSQGGTNGCGTVFKVNTDGGGYTVLKRFGCNTDGGVPEAGLVLSGTTLFGTTSMGGTNVNCGTVFKINTDGSGYAILHSFGGYPGNDGATPEAGLVLSGTTLFGTTSMGGINGNCGTVFKINTDGSGYAILHSFGGYPGNDGATPKAGLVLSGTTLFGTTSMGGTNGNYLGTVFSLSIAPPCLLTPLPSQTAEAGSTINFKPDIAGDPVLTYEWFFNGTNLISCGTNCNLELTNIQFSQSGSYTVVVTNLFGAVTSAPVMLNVIAPVTHRLVPCVNLMAQPGSSLGLDYCNALGSTANWETMATMTLSATSQFYFDITVPLPSQRFYRAWQSGTSSTIPSVNLPGMIPAVTLTGNVGNSLRLDGINQFGPTNAWTTLNTITLTNTSQLYFDVSALSQPPRLYRIVPVP